MLNCVTSLLTCEWLIEIIVLCEKSKNCINQMEHNNRINRISRWSVFSGELTVSNKQTNKQTNKCEFFEENLKSPRIGHFNEFWLIETKTQWNWLGSLIVQFQWWKGNFRANLLKNLRRMQILDATARWISCNRETAPNVSIVDQYSFLVLWMCVKNPNTLDIHTHFHLLIVIGQCRLPGSRQKSWRNYKAI
jgi:hypothetical protein